jgi:predicted TIM-barrel fold metal-dependent hydrolase
MTITIDIHDHIFSGRDLPLRGYLLSRRFDEWYIRLFAPILLTLLANYVRREGSDSIRPLERACMEFAYQYLGQGYRKWVKILSLRDASEIARQMIDTYQKDLVDLFVPLMIDFEYWFANTPDTSIDSQVQSVYQNVVLPNQGRIHPFAPFDPARELAFRKGLPNPDMSRHGMPEHVSSLELLKDAVRTKGFIGVKVFNTLGYRPLGNAAVDAQRRSIFQRNGMKQYTAFSGEEFDQVLIELYEFCMDEQVPMTAHCVSNGIEGYSGASLVFGGPRYWRAVLERYPTLHLNLAHYGWSRPDAYPPQNRWPWFTSSWRAFKRAIYRERSDIDPDGGSTTWTSEITDMMSRYPFLYTDVAHHSVVVDEDVPKFLASYQAISRDYPGLLQQRLLYGTDWHVITRMDHFQDFQERYLHMGKQGNIFSDGEADNFLGGNALHFLGLLPKSAPFNRGWTKNRERLAKFYKKHKIRPPGWFQASARR